MRKRLNLVGSVLAVLVMVLGLVVGSVDAQDAGCINGGVRCTIEHPNGDVDIWYNKTIKGGTEVEVEGSGSS